MSPPGDREPERVLRWQHHCSAGAHLLDCPAGEQGVPVGSATQHAFHLC